MSNTWGALSWGDGSWAAQGDVGLTVSGISASFSIGTVTPVGIIEIGWGGDSWGENEWGDLSGSQPNITGQQLTSSIGNLQSVTANAVVEPSGISLTSSLGEELAGISVTVQVTGSLESMAVGSTVIEIGVPVTGSSLTSNIGAATVDESQLTGIGWGRKTWGNLAWGGAYSVIATGQQLTSTINFPATGAFTDVNVSVTSAGQLTSTFASPSFSIQIDQDIFVLASEDQLDFTLGSSSITGDALVQVSSAGQLTSSQGTAVGGVKTPVDVTGSQINMTLGTFNLVQSTNEQPTGLQGTLSLGQHAEIPGQIIGVSGFQLTASVDDVSVTGIASVDVTGQELTSSVGAVNVTSWQEIDPGVNNVWTRVDLAA
tara:strand:- start:610 stop:1725 length:1116 start_codon:yes stop_codon:yes gene_type:complete